MGDAREISAAASGRVRLRDGHSRRVVGMVVGWAWS